ncbi:MAG: AMP-binding protein [Deinococcales bacterium]
MPIYPSLSQAFYQSYQRQPEKIFLYFEGLALSYADIYRQISQVAAYLKASGLEKGDRVALYLENSPSFISHYLAVLWLGAVIVPVNTRYRESELRHMLQDAQVKLVLSDAEGLSHIQEVLGACPSVQQVLCLGSSLADDLKVWQKLHPEDLKPILEPVALSGDDLALIGYTSGTTGRSKGALLSHGNFCSNSAAVTKAWHWTADDVLLLVLPLFHMHGLGVGLHGTLVQGSTIHLKRKFEAAEVYTLLGQGQVSMFFAVPTMYSRLLSEAAQHREGPEKFKHLRLLVSGSAPLSPQTHAEVEATFGLKILERYGMTETVMNTGNPYEGERKAGTVGLPFEGISLRIADVRSDLALAQGEQGEIQLKGPNISQGYWQRPEATAETWTADGWFKTGDLGFLDEDGYVTINGRAKELIISGGFNVYPREVEEVLEKHPEVSS